MVILPFRVIAAFFDAIYNRGLVLRIVDSNPGIQPRQRCFGSIIRYFHFCREVERIPRGSGR